VSLINGKLLTPLACSQWRLWFMKLSNAKIRWIAWIIISQFGCLKDFCILLPEREKIQINKLVVPPLSKLAAFVL
jgi:hypothetical protein